MKNWFPADWTPVGVMLVPTFTKRVPLLALGRSRRPGPPSQPRQAPPKRLTMEEEEKEDSDEDGAGAIGSDVSVDSELESIFQ